jgi:hypothetical protein
MAEDINIIDPSQGTGYDYSSWNLWENAEDGDITATGSDVQAVAECRGGADNSLVGTRALFGWTTDSTHYIEMRRHADETMTGVWNSSNYYFDLDTQGDYLQIAQSHVRIHGLQFYQSSGASGSDAQYCILTYMNSGYPALDWRIYNNIFRGDETANNSTLIYLIYPRANDNIVFVSNNMFLTSEDGFFFNNNYNYTTTVYCCNNTVACIDIGLRILDAYSKLTQYYRNNIIVSGARAWYPEETTGSVWTDDDDYNDYNFDVEPTTTYVPVGSHGGINTTFTLEDDSSGNKHEWDARITTADSGAKGNGQNLSNFTAIPQWARDILKYDIAGNERGSVWDAGAYQVTPAFSGYHLMV